MMSRREYRVVVTVTDPPNSSYGPYIYAATDLDWAVMLTRNPKNLAPDYVQNATVDAVVEVRIVTDWARLPAAIYSRTKEAHRRGD